MLITLPIFYKDFSFLSFLIHYYNSFSESISTISYLCRDTKDCKNCNQREDKWYILNHYPNCKINKK